MGEIKLELNYVWRKRYVDVKYPKNSYLYLPQWKKGFTKFKLIFHVKWKLNISLY